MRICGAEGRVRLERGILTVRYAADIPDEVILAAVERAGYRIRLMREA